MLCEFLLCLAVTGKTFRPVTASSYICMYTFASTSSRDVRACRDEQMAAAGASFCTVVLDVGGHIFKTTEETLCSVKGSRLCQLLKSAEYQTGSHPCLSQAAGLKELFIDRNGKVSAECCWSCLHFWLVCSATCCNEKGTTRHQHMSSPWPYATHPDNVICCAVFCFHFGVLEIFPGQRC